jgi:hypothetical protein
LILELELEDTMKIKYSNGKIQDVPGAFGSMFVTAGLATPYWEEAPARDLDSFKPTQVGTADWSYVKQDHGALLVAHCPACDKVLRSHKAFTFSHCGKNETCPSPLESSSRSTTSVLDIRV